MATINIPPHFLLFFLTFLAINLTPVLADDALKTCYYSAGTTEPLNPRERLMHPCNFDRNFTSLNTCCAAGDACLAGGMCLYTKSAAIYQGACLDKSFEGCFKGCGMEPGLVPMYSCKGKLSGKHVCRDPQGCEDSDARLVTLNDFAIVGTVPDDADETVSSTAGPKQTATETLPADATSKPEATGTEASGTKPDDEDRGKLALGIGIAIGAVFIVTACGVVCWVWRDRRRRRPARAETPPPSPPTMIMLDGLSGRLGRGGPSGGDGYYQGDRHEALMRMRGYY